MNAEDDDGCDFEATTKKRKRINWNQEEKSGNGGQDTEGDEKVFQWVADSIHAQVRRCGRQINRPQGEREHRDEEEIGFEMSQQTSHHKTINTQKNQHRGQPSYHQTRTNKRQSVY